MWKYDESTDEMCGSKCNQGTSPKEEADPVQKFDKDPDNCQVLVRKLCEQYPIYM
ncbi:hypothetical protein CK203_102677 [Vitis vinifera]|uniref:Uncharacterized protein n=1 Tax=Vitis vinifera TaxID=29760 RepID=A0A438FFG1_VITVI|nr:hypothetical protein CK203_102677 [Vitis vinifera]